MLAMAVRIAIPILSIATRNANMIWMSVFFIMNTIIHVNGFTSGEQNKNNGTKKSQPTNHTIMVVAGLKM